MAWSRRRRILFAVGLFLLVPAIGVSVWLLSGGPERAIITAYAEHMPGSLTIDAVAIESIDHASAQGIRIRDDDDREVAVIPGVAVFGSLVGGAVQTIQADRVELQLDQERLPFWLELIDRLGEPRHPAPPATDTPPTPPPSTPAQPPPPPPPPPPAPFDLAIPQIDILVAGASLLPGLQIHGSIVPGSAGAIDLVLEQADAFRCQIARQQGGVLSISCNGMLAFRSLVEALQAAGLVTLPADLLPHLPEQLLVTGTSWSESAGLTLDLVSAEPALFRHIGCSAKPTATGWQLEVALQWIAGIEPLAITLTADRDWTTIAVVDGKGGIPLLEHADIFDRLLGLGVTDPLRCQTLALNLPGLHLQKLAGTVLADGGLAGPLTVALGWTGGTCSLRAGYDDGVVQLADIALAAPIWGRLRGGVSLQPDGSGTLRWDEVAVGQGIRMITDLVGPQIATINLRALLDDVLTVVPQGMVTWNGSGDEQEVALALSGPEGAQVRASFSGAGAGMLRAARVPLTILDHLAPEVGVGGGQIETLTAEKVRTGWKVEAGIVGLSTSFGSWQVRDLSGMLNYMSLPGGKFFIDWTGAGDQAEQVEFQGRSGMGFLLVDVPDMALMIPKLEGPTPLPALTGRLDLTARISQPIAGAVPIKVIDLGLEHFTWPGILDQFQTRLQGAVTWWRSRLEAEVGGVVSGGLITARQWNLDLTAGRPEWQAGFTWHEDRQALQLHSLLVQGPDRQAPAYSASIRGDAAFGDEPEATVQLVIDPVHLDWLQGTIGRRELSDDFDLIGAASLVATLGYRDHGFELQEGWVLPMGSGLDLFDGLLRLHNIRGSIHLPRQRLPDAVRSADEQETPRP